jgi:hypothetical protein
MSTRGFHECVRRAEIECAKKALKVYEDCMKVEEDTYTCIGVMQRYYLKCINS